MTKQKDKSTFVKNLIRRRKSLGWSAELLAEKAGIPYPTLRDIEAGINNGRLPTKDAIASALGTTVDELNQITVPPPSAHQPTIQELSKVITALTAENEQLKKSNPTYNLSKEEIELLNLLKQASGSLKKSLVEVIRQTISMSTPKPLANKKRG